MHKHESYHLMDFDNWMYLVKQDPYQDLEYNHHSRKFAPALLQPNPPPSPSPSPPARCTTRVEFFPV